MATLEYWLLLVKERSKPGSNSELIEEADGILDRLTTFYKPEQFMALLPETERKNLVDFYCQKEDYWRIYWNKDANRNLDRALQIEHLLGAEDQQIRWTRWRQIDAYRLLGRDQEAMRMAEALLAEDLSVADRIGICKDYCWMKIVAGRPAEALVAVDPYIEPSSSTYNAALRPLLIERGCTSRCSSTIRRNKRSIAFSAKSPAKHSLTQTLPRRA